MLARLSFLVSLVAKRVSSTDLEVLRVTKILLISWCKGVFTWENSHRREFHIGMTFWFRIAFTRSGVISYLGYLKVHFMLIKYTCDSKSQTFTHALPVPGHRQTEFTPKRVVVSRLHDTVARFRTGVKFSPRYNNRGELTPRWLAPAWRFVVVSCKQM